MPTPPRPSPTHKNLDSLIEAEDSGTLSISDGKIIRTRIYHATKTVCDANVLYFGTEGESGSPEEDYTVATCVSEAIGAEQGRLTITWETDGPASATLPPQEVSVSGDNLSPRTERHPRYISLKDIAGELGNVETASRAQDSTDRDEAYDALSPRGKELVDKIRRGNESFYLCSLRYGWASHSFTRPTMYRGGWIEAPGGPLAGYFSGDISWLRQADDLQYNNGIWRLTRSWLGAANTQWDHDLYPV